MRPRIAALAAGLGLVAAAAVAAPASPASAAEPLPPCFPTTSPTAQPVIPDPAGSGIWLPAVPLDPGILRLPGINYCDPSLSLPLDLSALGTIMPGLPVLGPAVNEVLDAVAPALPDIRVPDAPIDLPGGDDYIAVPVPPAAWPPAFLDESAPVFTQPAAQSQMDTLQIEGLKAIELVTVRTAEDGDIPVVRITADAVVLDGFTLDVRKKGVDHVAVVNNSARMELRGNVRMYIQSLTASGPGGVGITIGADTPPPGEEVPTSFAAVSIGLVGALADSSVWTQTHQWMHEGD